MLKKILGLALASVILLTLAVGGTWAYLSDTGKASNNAILAGNLFLKTSNDGGHTLTSGSTQSLTSLKLKPTQTKTATIFLYNDALNIDATYLDISFNYTKVNGDQNGTAVMDVDATASMLRITILQRDREPSATDLLALIPNSNGTSWIDLEDLKNATSGIDSSHIKLNDLPGLAAGDNTTITIGIQMVGYDLVEPDSALDAFQGDGVDITMKFTLRQ